jgi:hypothetical protein
MSVTNHAILVCDMPERKSFFRRAVALLNMSQRRAGAGIASLDRERKTAPKLGAVSRKYGFRACAETKEAIS